MGKLKNKVWIYNGLPYTHKVTPVVFKSMEPMLVYHIKWDKCFYLNAFVSTKVANIEDVYTKRKCFANTKDLFEVISYDKH